jgi:hypothetical protein
MHVNIDDQHLHMLANTFGCAIRPLPFTYLGLPLDTTRPTVQDLTPVVDHIERQLNASVRFLYYGGRLTLVYSVLSSLPTHFICSLKVHKRIMNIADRSSHPGDIVCGQKRRIVLQFTHLPAWSVVCKPKKMEALGLST